MKVFSYLMNYPLLGVSVVALTALLGAYWLLDSDTNDLVEHPVAVNLPVAESISANTDESPVLAREPNPELMNLTIPQSSISESTDNLIEEPKASLGSLVPDAQGSLFAGMELKELFKDTALNEHTVYVAELLRMEFDDSFEHSDQHFRQVENFLSRALDDPQKVAELLSFYRDFTEFQTSQAQDPQPLWLENPETIDDAIKLNNEKQQYRSAFFGEKVADQVWGQEQKESEYRMKVLQILRNDDYGADTVTKEQLITELRAETWGAAEQSAAEEQRTRFYTKLANYGEELLKMTDEDREAKINEFRAEIFSAEEAQSMTQEDKKPDTGS